MSFLRKSVPLWSLLAVLAAWLVTGFFTLSSARSHGALAERVREHEKDEIVAPFQSMLHESCDPAWWFNRLRSWWRGVDACDKV